MSDIGILIVARITLAAICFLGAAFVASKNVDGWGWLIFAGIIMGAITLSDGECES